MMTNFITYRNLLIYNKNNRVATCYTMSHYICHLEISFFLCVCVSLGRKKGIF